MTNETRNGGEGFDLAALLNILWRRRLIVLGLPLLGLIVGVGYGIFGTRRWEATATVRPGITAYDPSGGPVRQWQMKDITRWYEKELYRRDLNDRLGLPRRNRPVIRTEFIAQGLTNLAGGEVITLWTTATSPELAAALLDTSLMLFNRYAESDSVSSQVKLTRDGLQLQVRELRSNLLAVDRQEAGVRLKLESARAESLLSADKGRQFLFEMEMLESKEAFCAERVAGLDRELPALEAELRSVGAPGGSGQDLSAVAEARLDLQRALARNRAVADSLRYEGNLAALERQRIDFKRQVVLEADLREVERKIGELLLERDLDVPAKRREIGLQIDARQSKLSLLSPLQKVGTTVVSDKPVRPRTVRAIAILLVLGTLGGLVLAFVWDYVSVHRREIFRP